MAYLETWAESVPDGGEARSLGDDRIKAFKRAIRERLASDHEFYADESGHAYVGYHAMVKMTQQSSPVAITDIGQLYCKNVSGATELFYTDEAGNEIQFTSGGKVLATNLTGIYPAANVAALATMMNLIYPVGIVITLGVTTNPATLLGVGTWTAIAGKVIVGINAGDAEFDALDETGGEKTHTLITAEMPAHIHGTRYGAAGYGNLYHNESYATDTNTAAAQNTGSTGGDGAHNNLQPYIVKYVWQRTA